jgi:hypothetical protein
MQTLDGLTRSALETAISTLAAEQGVGFDLARSYLIVGLVGGLA